MQMQATDPHGPGKDRESFVPRSILGELIQSVLRRLKVVYEEFQVER